MLKYLACIFGLIALATSAFGMIDQNKRLSKIAIVFMILTLYVWGFSVL